MEQKEQKKDIGKPLLSCLVDCKLGSELIVKSIMAGFGAKRRLAQLGLIPGAIIKKKRQAPFHGPVEIEVKGSSLVIGRGIANKVFVECDKECAFNNNKN